MFDRFTLKKFNFSLIWICVLNIYGTGTDLDLDPCDNLNPDQNQIRRYPNPYSKVMFEFSWPKTRYVSTYLTVPWCTSRHLCTAGFL